MGEVFSEGVCGPLLVPTLLSDLNSRDARFAIEDAVGAATDEGGRGKFLREGGTTWPETWRSSASFDFSGRRASALADIGARRWDRWEPEVVEVC
jgi:hypothetical protein